MIFFDRRTFLSATGAVWLTTQGESWAAVASPEGGRGDAAAFARRFGGTVFERESADYARLARIYQARAQARPALFAHCTGTDDVRRAILAARETGAGLAVRCGGHSYAGYSLSDNGVVLDLSGMRRVEIAPDATSVTVAGGTLAGMIDQATAARGRAMTLGQCPTVGIGGFALGGGVGPLMGRQGLGCDHLLSAEIVLADGRVAIASADADADLYWAVRGGGGNFGVATSLTFALREVGEVLGGYLTLRSPDPRDMLRLYGELCRSAPDELTMLAMLVPDGERRPSLQIQVCHCGAPDRAQADLAPLLASAHVVATDVRRRAYGALQTQGPAEVPVIPTINRAGFREALDEDAVETVARAASEAPCPYMIGFVPIHGATTGVDAAATAFPVRQAGMAFGLTAILTGPESAAATEGWTTGLARDLHQPGTGVYVNVMDDEGSNAVRAAYGANYSRLAALKARYDPDNVFHRNQNILPAV